MLKQTSPGLNFNNSIAITLVSILFTLNRYLIIEFVSNTNTFLNLWHLDSTKWPNICWKSYRKCYKIFNVCLAIWRTRIYIGLTLPVLYILESCIKINISLNFYCHTSLWCFKRFYEGHKDLHKTFWGTFIKPFDAPQRSVKIEFKLIFSLRPGSERKG